VEWQKLGRVYVAEGHAPWARRRAFLPTSLPIGEDRLRVFVAFLDDDLVGRVGYVDVDAADPTQVLAVSEHPVLDIGEPGMFDDSGVNPLSVFRTGGRLWLYYMGWQRSSRVPYLLFCGLAHSEDEGLTFHRHAPVPVFDRSPSEPLMRAGAFVLPRRDGGFRAWYSSGDTWLEANGRTRPTYALRYAESPDGVTWPAEGTTCLEPAGPDEYGLARPFVSDHGDGFSMLFSVRSHSRGYRMGYAESADGVRWERRDGDVGIDVSERGWDSEMVHSGWIQRTDHGTYLFYNGNGYGESGFGVAAMATNSS
jgi:hypothetical protein